MRSPSARLACFLALLLTLTVPWSAVAQLTTGQVPLGTTGQNPGVAPYTLPTGNGTNGQFLQTNGSGVTSWATAPGGSVTVNTATTGQLGYYSSGTAISGNANATISNGALTLGTVGTVGNLLLAGNTSGTITIQPQAAAGTYNFNLPTGAGTSGQPLLSAGGGSAAMTFGTLGVGAGGTGQTTLTNHGVLVGAGASAVTQLAAAAAGTVLTGQGSTTDPSFSATPTLGVNATTAGTLGLANGGASGATITLQNLGATTAYNFNFPTTAGTSGQPMLSGGGGSGNMTFGTLSVGGGGTGATTFTANGILYGNTTSALQVTGAGTAKQILTAGSPPAFIDFPDVKYFPGANCVNSLAGSAFSEGATPAATCYTGTNNVGGYLSWANNNTTTTAQFFFELPNDWDTATQPYVKIIYSSLTNTTGTVKWTFSTACTKGDGSITDDPAFHAESTFGPDTMATANRMWADTQQLTAVTSGNNCIAGSPVILKITSGNGTASAALGVYMVTVTIPRLLTVQAN
jgi:hypothetical protein